jgi:DNA-binding CsgD family transcriptional regulator
MTASTVREPGGVHGHNLTLSPREAAILCLIAGGFTNLQMARKLHISRHTVAQHIAEMLRRAPAANRAELVARAYAVGILPVGIWPPPTSLMSW